MLDLRSLNLQFLIGSFKCFKIAFFKFSCSKFTFTLIVPVNFVHAKFEFGILLLTKFKLSRLALAKFVLTEFSLAKFSL